VEGATGVKLSGMTIIVEISDELRKYTAMCEERRTRRGSELKRTKKNNKNTKLVEDKKL